MNSKEGMDIKGNRRRAQRRERVIERGQKKEIREVGEEERERGTKTFWVSFVLNVDTL